MKNFGIYIHIPFCVSKCNYCSFVSKPASVFDIKKYVNFLCQEIENKSKIFNKKICTSVYFGGGTPSLIDEKNIKKILKIIKNNYNLSKDAEITIECNPNSLNKNKLLNYLSFGINRLSIGVQSFNNKQLKIIGRKHNGKQPKKIIKLAQKLGFNNISVDLLIGIPKQTKTSLLKSVKSAIKLNINHISCYMLMLEKNTPLYEMVKNKKVKVADDDKSVDLYNLCYKLLNKNGYHRYEISNFAKDGFECKHNINYWQMGEYVGFGVSAHSYYNKTRISNSNCFDGYYKGTDIGKEKLNKQMIIEETIMLGLRQQMGVSISKLKRLGYDILTEKEQEIQMLKDNGMITIDDDYIKVTENFYGLISAIILRLI